MKNNNLVEEVIRKILNKWKKIKNKIYIAGVLGWLNVVVREELEHFLLSAKKEWKDKVIKEIEKYRIKYTSDYTLRTINVIKIKDLIKIINKI